MSVELCLFPQTASNGSMAAIDYISDGLFFTTLNASPVYSHGGTNVSVGAAVANQFPTIPNTWYRADGSCITTSPTQVGSDVVFTAPGSVCTSAIYQNLDGLATGAQYTVTINTNAFTAGGVTVFHHNGVAGGLQAQAFITTGTSTLTLDITGTTTGDNIIFVRASLNGANVEVTDISVLNFSSNTEYIGQTIVDLYEHEEIPLTLSVDNFKNAAEKTQSYSKDFNLPATKRNNRIFGQIFEITRTVTGPPDFNPLVFTRAVLKQDGFILFDGALRLIDIQERNGERSYNVNLYAQTIALATILKNRTFANIDFSELEHAYNKQNIKNSFSNTAALTLINSLSTSSYAYQASLGVDKTNVLKYPFVDWTGNWAIGDGAATGAAGNSGFPEFDQLEDIYRPWIKIKYLIDRIFSEAGYTYDCDLFDSSDFKRLFMDFNWGGQTVPALIEDTSYTGNRLNGADISIPGTYVPLQIYPAGYSSGGVTGDAASSVPPTYDSDPASADAWNIVETVDSTRYIITVWVTVTLTGGSGTRVAFCFKQFDSAGVIKGTYGHYVTPSYTTSGPTGVFTAKIECDAILMAGDRLRVQMRRYSGSGTLTYGAATQKCIVSSGVITSAHLLNLRGDLNQWDFFKGILTMFNLVTLQDEKNSANIIIKTYNDAFMTSTQGDTLEDRGIKFDWTDKVDLKDIKLTPLTNLKARTVFRYAEDEDDYLFNVYKNSAQGYLYGSKVFNENNLSLLEGSEEIVASPFAATINKPIMSQFEHFTVPTIYSMGSDGVAQPYDNKPRILYQVTTGYPGYDLTTFGYTFYIPEQNGYGSENSNHYLLFSHLQDMPTLPGTTFDYNFGECQYLTPQGVTVNDNLFNEYWSRYYYELYNPDTKVMTLKVNLNAGDIARFKFTDKVLIKNREYRVNRIDYKPHDLSTVEFILIP
jgi:hypothetical protein